MSNMIKVKAGDLSGAALDWAVDAAETGDPMRVEYKKDGSGVWMLFDKHNMYAPNGPQKYSSDWKLAGPIIERERISTGVTNWDSEAYAWIAHWPAYVQLAVGRVTRFEQCGPTPLIAAMRCYVAAKLGDEIEVPAELVEGGA